MHNLLVIQESSQRVYSHLGHPNKHRDHNLTWVVKSTDAQCEQINQEEVHGPWIQSLHYSDMTEESQACMQAGSWGQHPIPCIVALFGTFRYIKQYASGLMYGAGHASGIEILILKVWIVLFNQSSLTTSLWFTCQIGQFVELQYIRNSKATELHADGQYASNSKIVVVIGDDDERVWSYHSDLNQYGVITVLWKACNNAITPLNNFDSTETIDGSGGAISLEIALLSWPWLPEMRQWSPVKDS